MIKNRISLYYKLKSIEIKNNNFEFTNFHEKQLFINLNFNKKLIKNNVLKMHKNSIC